MSQGKKWSSILALVTVLASASAVAVPLPVKSNKYSADARKKSAQDAAKPGADVTYKVPEKFRLQISDEERERLTDQKRDQIISQLERIASRFDSDSPQKAALLFQLSEYDWEKSKYLYHVEMRDQDAAYKEYEAAKARGEKAKEPGDASHKQSEKYRAMTMRIYEDLLSKYPDYDRKDEVLFSLAYNLYELNDNEAALKRYAQLIKEFPHSQFVPDAYVQLGNHYFDHNDLERATFNYQKALATQIPKIYSYALYKLAWCDYNAGEFEHAREKLQKTIDYADGHGKDMVDLRNEALNDLIVVYVRLDRGEEAITYFTQKASVKRAHKLITKLANALADAGRNDNAIKVFRVLLAKTPDDPQAPEWQQSVIHSYEQLREREQVKTEIRRLAELYHPGSQWWVANAKTPQVLQDGFNASEEAMRNVVTEYHQEAQKTKQVETYRLARDIYRQYLEAFASAKDAQFVSDQAFNMKFYYAEILWTLEDWDGAAKAYGEVASFKVPDRPGAKEISNEKYRQTAAYDQILAYDKLVKIDKGTLAQSTLQDGQKVDENRGKGKVEKGSKLSLKAGSAEEQPLSEHEQQLVAACDEYVKRFPNPKDEIDIRYQAAVVLYDKDHYVDAAKRFGEIIMKWPEERRSQQAADLTMHVLETRQEWAELNRIAREFLANKRLTKPGSEFAQRVAGVVEGSQYKFVDEVVYKQQKDAPRAAEEFLKFVAEFPRSPNADKALTYAGIIYDEAGELDRSIEVGQRVLAEYPESPLGLKVRYTLAHAYERSGQFERSAQMDEDFLAAYDRASGKPLDSARGDRRQGKANKSKKGAAKSVESSSNASELVKEAAAWVPDAQFNAALWWEGLGKDDRALAAYRAYLTRFPDRKDVPEVAFNIAVIEEKAKRLKDAQKSFEDFGHTYGKDARVAGTQRFLALYHLYNVDRQLKADTDADRLAKELVASYPRLPPKEKQQADVLNAYGHLRFLALEPLWQQYTAAKLNKLSAIKQELAQKQKLLKEVEKQYLEVLSTGAGQDGIAALTRIGLAYADLAKDIQDSPTPKGLDDDQMAMYRGELDKLALPLEDKASEALEKGLAKAYELNIYSEWTIKAQDAVNALKPGSYGKIPDVKYTGSEPFSAGPLATKTPRPVEPPKAPLTPSATAPLTPSAAAPLTPSATAPLTPSGVEGRSTKTALNDARNESSRSAQ